MSPVWSKWNRVSVREPLPKEREKYSLAELYEHKRRVQKELDKNPNCSLFLQIMAYVIRLIRIKYSSG